MLTERDKKLYDTISISNRYPNGKKKQVKCLNCDEMMVSDSRDNRICGRCTFNFSEQDAFDREKLTDASYYGTTRRTT